MQACVACIRAGASHQGCFKVQHQHWVRCCPAADAQAHRRQGGPRTVLAGEHITQQAVQRTQQVVQKQSAYDEAIVLHTICSSHPRSLHDLNARRCFGSATPARARVSATEALHPALDNVNVHQVWSFRAWCRSMPRQQNTSALTP